MSTLGAQGGAMSHPNCTNGHVCQKPSGRTCIEAGCDIPAGTDWGPMWCPDHDRERLDRISGQMEALFAPAPSVPEPESGAGQ